MTAIVSSTARLWQQHPRELIALGALTAAAAIAAAGTAWSTPGIDQVERPSATTGTPAPPPLLVRDVAPEKAVTLNDKIPLSSGPNPAAAPFSTAGLDATSRARALDCLTSAVYYEAGNESEDGKRAVAQVVLNRVRHPAFPSSVCGVVYQGSTRSTGCQFTFTCDGSLARRPNVSSWTRARSVADAALGGFVFAPVGWATHYHANYVLPYWAPTLAKNAVIGAHLFYRWSGGWGRPPAFTQRYARVEPNSGVLRSTSLAAFETRVSTPEAETAEAAVEELAETPGVKVEKSQAGRLAIRFDLAKARKATEDLPEKKYVEKVAASDNLRWSLAAATADDKAQAPLGSKSVKVPSPPSSGPAAATK